MIKTKVGFVIYGVHKDGITDNMGTPHMNYKLFEKCKDAIRKHNIELVEEEVIVATKAEAIAAMSKLKKDDEIDAVILFSGTWVWSGYLVGAVQDFARTGKPIVIWTHPGSQGWRNVGGLVMHAALMELGINHRFVHGAYDDEEQIEKIVSYVRAASVKNKLNLSTVGTFGGRGMGQSCGVADPSQWMKTFGIDIDSRDTYQLIECAKSITQEEIKALEPRLIKLFGGLPVDNEVSDHSIRLYLAIKKMMKEYGFDYYTIQSFPGIGDDYSGTCFAQSMILEDGIGTSTLCDFNTLMTTIILTELSEERVYYGDLQNIDRENKEIKIIGDGACPPSLAGKVDPAVYATHDVPTEGKKDSIAVQLTCKPGKGVLAHLGRRDGKFEMIVARCEVFEPKPEELQKRKEECGTPFWPHGFVTVEGDMDDFIEGWNNEYACLGYGEHLYNEIVAFCEQTGIRVIKI